MITVELSPDEMRIGKHVGLCRAAANRERGNEHRHGTPPEVMIEADIVGAQGEMAVAKHLNVYWSGNTRSGDYDVGGFLQVKTTMATDLNLIVRLNAKPTDPYALAWRKGGPQFVMVGWMWAAVAMQEQYRTKQRYGGEAYYFPHRRVWSLDTIIIPTRQAILDGMNPDDAAAR